MKISKAMQWSERIITQEKEMLSKLQKLAAKNMRVRRLAKRMPMRGAARLLGISASYYSDLENGHRNISARLAARMEEIL